MRWWWGDKRSAVDGIKDDISLDGFAGMREVLDESETEIGEFLAFGFEMIHWGFQAFEVDLGDVVLSFEV